MPVAVIVGYSLTSSDGIWSHLASTVLGTYVKNSLWLMAGVAVGTTLLGVTGAWLVAMCEFPGRKIFEWALLLPLAMPAYIIAYTYTGMLDTSGPVQSWLRDIGGWQYGEYWFPAIRSLGGAIIMLSLVLYPYVYLLTRAAFVGQSICVLDVSRTLGSGPWRSFFKVALPLARPAIAAGLALALMETLADYGTVKYYGVSTFTTGIFRTWYGLDSLAGAAQLASVLLGFVILVIVLERLSRRRMRYHATSQRHQAIRRHSLRGRHRVLAVLFCLTTVTLGFLLPAGQLLSWAIQTAAETINPGFFKLIVNSVGLAATAAVLASVLALWFGYQRRTSNTPTVRLAGNLIGMGYAIPGMVIAVGVIIPLAWFDNTLDQWLRTQFNFSTGLLLSGTVVALILAYTVRFLAVALQSVDAGLQKITPAMDEAAQLHGYSNLQTLRRVHIPLLKGSLLTAVLLVFVDVLKELPATLILRPFNFNTLAVRAFELASDERLADSATAALTIVLAGIVPVILLSRSITLSRHERTA